MTSVLTIVSTGYRATAEEQDDTALWFAGMCADNIEVHVLLAGSAVQYGVDGEQPPMLQLSGRPAARTPDMADEVRRLLDKGIPVSYLVEDAEAYGVDPSTLIGGLKPTKRSELASLVAAHDLTWRF